MRLQAEKRMSGNGCMTQNGRFSKPPPLHMHRFEFVIRYLYSISQPDT